jgi:hypothetical protein
MTSPLHIETVNAATKVVQYVRIGRASEDGLDHIALAGNVLTAIVCWHHRSCLQLLTV